MSDTKPRPVADFINRRTQAFAAMSSTARRVKIEQNHTWRLRLLPVELGPDREPFVDIAQHWWNKTPITCPHKTSPAWGGSQDFQCPICEISSRLTQSTNEDINTLGFKVRCNLKVRAWCAVFDIEDHRGNVEEMPMSEVLNPYEFDMYKTTWETFTKYQKWATTGRRGGPTSEWGVLDLMVGCDLLATHTSKGISLDRCDPAPIFDPKDPKFDERVQKLLDRVRDPQIEIPTEKQLLEVALKIEEYAERGGRGGRDDRGGRGGRGGRDYDREYDRSFDRSSRGRGGRDDHDDRDSGYSSRSRGRSFTEDDEASAGRRRSDDDESPRRRSFRDEPESGAEPTAATSRRTATRTAPATESQAEESRQEEATEQPARTERRLVEAVSDRQTTATSRTRTVDQTREPIEPENSQAEEETTPPPTKRQTTAGGSRSAHDQTEPSQRSTSSTRRTAPVQVGVDEEEDNVPEERVDPAPVEPRAEVDNEEPERVAVPAPSPRRTSATNSLQERLSRLNQKGK